MNFSTRYAKMRTFGVLAHLVERFHGMEEVRSSNLLHSTKENALPFGRAFSFGVSIESEFNAEFVIRPVA